MSHVIQEALTTYSADRIGAVDYALLSLGTKIVGKHTSVTYEPGQRKKNPTASFFSQDAFGGGGRWGTVWKTLVATPLNYYLGRKVAAMTTRNPWQNQHNQSPKMVFQVCHMGILPLS